MRRSPGPSKTSRSEPRRSRLCSTPASPSKARRWLAGRPEFADAELGPQAAGTANIYRLFGDTLFDQQRYAEAEPLFRKALAIREKVLGPDHPDTARSNGDLAVTLKWLKRFDEAELLYRRALAIREKAFGPDSGDVAQSWFRLSRLFDAKGDHAKAAEMLEHAVAVGEKAYGARAQDRDPVGRRASRAAARFR